MNSVIQDEIKRLTQYVVDVESGKIAKTFLYDKARRDIKRLTRMLNN